MLLFFAWLVKNFLCCLNAPFRWVFSVVFGGA